MCCKSSYNKSSIFRRNFRMFSFWGSWFLSNMFPLSFAEVKYQYKNATNMFFVCFWRRKSNIFSFFLKNCKTSREKKKHPNPVEAPRTSGTSMSQRRKWWFRLFEEHEIMLSKQLRTCILPDAKTNWPKREYSFPTFQQTTLLPFLIFKWKLHCPHTTYF